MWPDEPADQAAERCHDAIKSLRRVLRETTGIRSAKFVLHAAGRYKLEPHLVDTDLWRFRRALTEAHHAASDETRLDVLRHAAETYRGDFCAETTYE